MNILILSSHFTGHGHKSISDSLVEQFDKMDDVHVRVVDGFSLFGRTGVGVSKMYGPITRRRKEAWKLVYSIASIKPNAMNEMLEVLLHDRFLDLIASWMPDAIISVHAVFNGSILGVLDTYGLDIPFFTLLADLVDIHPLWMDARATIFCPTEEGYDACLQNSMPENRLLRCSFPIRERFSDAVRNLVTQQLELKNRPLRCLLMSGGEGSGDLVEMAKIILENFPCEVHILCGRNQGMVQKLEENLKRFYPSRLHPYGFLDNVQDVMLDCDFAIVRGSPNSMLEAVVLGLPLIITGALPGQEANNPSWAQKHHLAICCNGTQGLRSAIARLLANECALLYEIKDAQQAFRNLDAPKEIAQMLLSRITPKERTMPAYKHKLLHTSDARKFLERMLPMGNETLHAPLSKRTRKRKSDQ